MDTQVNTSMLSSSQLCAIGTPQEVQTRQDLVAPIPTDSTRGILLGAASVMYEDNLRLHAGLAGRLGILDKLLTPAILLAMIIGVIIGEFVPSVQSAFNTVRFKSVSLREYSSTNPSWY